MDPAAVSSSAGRSSPTTMSASADAPTASARPRDRFLDLLRMVSVLRVIALHTCSKPPIVYFPWIQWIFPGMPEVFFVSGAVMAATLRRRPWAGVLRGRFRRLLPPFYVYAVVALAVMIVTDLRSPSPLATVDRGDVLSFIFPIVRPTGSVTRVVLWGHLWFLNAFVWVIALAPLTYWMHRRLKGSPLVLFGLAFIACVALDKLGRHGIRSEFYDVTLFGWFFQLGYLYDDGILQRIRPRVHLAIGVVLGVAGWTVAERIEPVWRKGLNELYGSQSGHLLIGAAWMFGAFAAREPIQRWLAHRSGRGLDLVTRRTYTLFIWGPSANALAFAAVRHFGLNRVLYFAVTSASLFGLLLAFGWVEDVAAKRKPELLPGWRLG